MRYPKKMSFEEHEAVAGSLCAIQENLWTVRKKLVDTYPVNHKATKAARKIARARVELEDALQILENQYFAEGYEGTCPYTGFVWPKNKGWRKK